MYYILQYKDTVFKEVTLYTYLYYVIKTIQTYNDDDSRLCIQELFKGGMLVIQDNYNLNEYDTPTILSQKSALKLDTRIPKPELKSFIDKQQSNPSITDANIKIKKFTPETSLATKAIEKKYVSLLIKDLDTLKSTPNIGIFFGSIAKLYEGVQDIVPRTVDWVRSGPEVATPYSTTRGGTKKNVYKRNVTYKYKGGVLDQTIVSFTDWCYANITKSSSKNITSIAKKTIFIKTFLNNADITTYQTSTIYNNITNIVSPFMSWVKKDSSIPLNDALQKLFTTKLNDLKKKNQLISICFKNMKNMGCLSRQRKIEDDSILINEYNKYTYTFTDEQRVNYDTSRSEQATYMRDMLVQQTPPLPNRLPAAPNIIPPSLNIYIDWKNTNISEYQTLPNNFFSNISMLVKVIMGFTKNYR
jgi:hypothetical protein